MKKLISNLLLTSLLGGSIIISGCSKDGDPDKNKVTIKGSDTMARLVSSWAERYMEKNSRIEISVTGGGSGTGIEALLNNTTDIAASSRSIRKKETASALKKKIKLVSTVVAKDGIAVIVNKANKISSIPLELLSLIYTGDITNWSNVGGSDKKIDVLSRGLNSDIYIFFQKYILRKDDYAKGTLFGPTSFLAQTVNDNENAIGYVELRYVDDSGENVKTLAIKTSKGNVFPSEETVKSGEYPIALPLLFYVNGEAAGNVKAFIDFCLSAEGQKIVSEIGFVPIAE